MEDQEALENLRNQIDSIDKEIVSLINKRTEVVLKVGSLKKNDSRKIYRPAREIEIFNKLEDLNKDNHFPTRVLIEIYKEIISACRSLEAPLEIAYLGPEATNTHQAAITQFGSSCHFLPFKTISDVFKEVETGKVHYGVIPLENSNEGVVNHTLDTFILSPLMMFSEQYLQIHHHLLSSCPDIEKIKRIYSHPQAFGQCRLWIENNMPSCELIESTSTAEAVNVSLWDKYSAAIAGKIAAEVHDEVKILAENIEDNPSNFTRFIIVAKKDNEAPSRSDKTSLLFVVKDQPGALNTILQIFASNGINMNKIESRPSKKKAWEYLFFVDIDGHRTSDKVSLAISQIKEQTTFFKILGSYPKVTVQIEE